MHDGESLRSIEDGLLKRGASAHELKRKFDIYRAVLRPLATRCELKEEQGFSEGRKDLPAHVFGQ